MVTLPHKNPHPPGWYFKKWGIILLLILFGPLAFPFLWKTRVFSRRPKIILTAIFGILTVFMTLHAVHVAKQIWEEFRKSGLVP